MTKLVTLFAFILTLNFIGSSTVLADDSVPSEGTTIQSPAHPMMDKADNQDQLCTPAERSSSADLADQGDAFEVNIRDCTASEQAKCGDGCGCLFVFPMPRCAC